MKNTPGFLNFDSIANTILHGIKSTNLENLKKLFNYYLHKDKDFIKKIDSYMQTEMRVTPVSFAINENKTEALEFVLNYKFSTVINIKSGDISAIEYLFLEYLNNEIKDPIPLLKCLLQNNNTDCYNVNANIFHLIANKDTKVFNGMKKLMTEEAWKKINLLDKAFNETTKDLTEFMFFWGKDIKLHLKNVAVLPDIVGGSKITEKQLNTIYCTVKKMCSTNDLKYLNYGKNNNPIFLKAANLKKWNCLEVMLKALNSIDLVDKTKSLNELIIMSSKSVEGLLVAFVKNYGLNTKDDKGNTILHYAVLAEKLDLVQKLVLNNDFIQSSLELAQKIKNQEICDFLTNHIKIQEQVKLAKLNKINNQPLSKPEEKFKITEETIKPKTSGSVKNNILKKLYEQYKGQYYMSEELLKELDEHGISSDNYKNYAQEENQQNSTKPEIKREVVSWVVKGKTYSTDKDKIFCHKYQGKQEYYLTLDKNLFDDLEKVDQDKVLTALEKGFAKTRLDDSGIKLFGGVMEIKVLAKNQVFSQLGYVIPIAPFN